MQFAKQFSNAVTGGDDFCKQVGPACACGEGLGLWGKAGIEEEEEGPQKGSSGGQDILRELGGWGLEGCLGSESGAGHWKADEGAGYRSQFAEPGRGKMPGSVLGKCCSQV